MLLVAPVSIRYCPVLITWFGDGLVLVGADGGKTFTVMMGSPLTFPFLVLSSSSTYSPLELCWFIEMLESAWHRDSRLSGLEEILVGPSSSPNDRMLAMVTLDMSSSSSS